jgi:D-lactate dehydrogenase (cytochrome)
VIDQGLGLAGTQTRAWLVAQLRERLPGRVSTSPGQLDEHGRSEGHHASRRPDAIVRPAGVEDVSLVLQLCQAARVPVVACGARTSLEGGTTPLLGGISLDLSGLDDVVNVNVDDLDATVGPGVTHVRLNELVRPQGLFFSVDPGAPATIGGMCATRASGTTTVRYGTMRDNVLGLTVVLADGRVIRTGGHARKSAAGYDLTSLMLGSEGTLGIITEVVVRLHPTPEAVVAATCTFPDLDSAIRSVVEVLQSGVTPARIELLDEAMVDAVVRFTDLALKPGPAVFYEFHGSSVDVAEQVRCVRAIAQSWRGDGFREAASERDRRQLWRARHDALPAARALRPGSRSWSTDVCVPLSRLVQCLNETTQDLAASGLLAPIAGHVGDGNFHLALVVDPSDSDEMSRARALEARLVHRALRMGGTCSGEHGIGMGKIDHLAREAGPALEVMRSVKQALDPYGILNPG